MIILEYFTAFIYFWTVVKDWFYLVNARKTQNFMSFWSTLRPIFCEKLRQVPIFVTANKKTEPFLIERNSRSLQENLPPNSIYVFSTGATERDNLGKSVLAAGTHGTVDVYLQYSRISSSNVGSFVPKHCNLLLCSLVKISQS